MNKVLSKLDKTVMKTLSNNVVRFIIFALSLGYLISIQKIPINILENFKNIYFRVVIALLIAYLACFEPLYAILLATIFILSLQELHNRVVSKDIVKSISTTPSITKVSGDNNVNKKVFLEDKVLNDVELKDAKIKNLREDKLEHPADNNLTDNLNKSYISNKNLVDAQTNLIEGSDPDRPVEVFDKILNAQGLSIPKGFDTQSSKSSKF